jgi:hypothetical protein
MLMLGLGTQMGFSDFADAGFILEGRISFRG